MTLEEAQARILELTEQNQTLTAERDSLSQNNETLRNEAEELRKMNQLYFNKLIQQVNPTTDPDPEPDPPTCEEFAASLNI